MGIPGLKGRARRGPRPQGMNGLEADYAARLTVHQIGGKIARWDYEPEKLRLADNTTYTPDFRVLLPDGTVEFHETKGFMRDDAWVKLKVAAELHPYTFRLVRKVKGQWIVEEV